MRKSIILIIIIGILSAVGLYIILIPSQQSSFTPSVDLKLDKDTIPVDDNAVSSEFVTATITRLDDEDISAVFVMKFFPHTPENIYPVDSDGKKLNELSTRPLKGKNAQDILQFKVFGKKGEFTGAKSKIRIELWWNNTKVENTEKVLGVSVT